MQDVFTKKFERKKVRRKHWYQIQDGKGLTVVVCKSENVQKKVPYTPYLLTGKIAKIFLLQRRYWEEEKGGKEGEVFYAA